MSRIVGIDLGTTNSLIAIMEADGPKLIPNSLGQKLTPSVVGVEGEHLLVGMTAKEYQVSHPDHCASVFKRYMGSDWSVTLAGRKMSAIDLSSCVLRSLVADAEHYLGEAVTSAVITVPAYFNEEQRRATIAAGQMAGLKVERIVNEPTAAAIAYGLHEADSQKTAVIIDLGGGTFDVSIVEMFEGVLEIRASAGEIFLGGEDFTDACVSQILNQAGMKFEHTEMQEPLRVSRLRRECEQAKRRLTIEASTEVRLPNSQGEIEPDAPRYAITRETFDLWTKSTLDRILSPIRRALGDAGLKRQEIDEVILAGGASRMPSLIKRIEELFEKPTRCTINPDEVVALGAAVNAGILDRHESLSEIVVTDVAPFTMGVEICREIGGEDRDGYYLPIINRNTTIPVSRVERVVTRAANQSKVNVSVYQGESRLVKDNQLLGSFEVTGIPPGPPGQEIDIRFTYDLNGILEAEAVIVKTQKRAAQVFTRHMKNLSESQMKTALDKMQALKAHPRDEEENRLLLKWAERLYMELPYRERNRLDQLITGFEEVLESQDQAQIKLFAEELGAFLKAFDSFEGEQGDYGTSPSDE